MAGTKHWQFNLYSAMQDPAAVVYRDNVVVIIKDKFPKSELHFLVLPVVNIPDVRSLTASHIQLLRHMEIVTDRFICNYPGHTFWWGFHAVPTMVQLHLHVISDDFRGSGLKTARHWNSYTTSFFIPLSKAISDLETNGRVILPPQPMCEALLHAPIACHKCGYRPTNMPTLKVHLLSHVPV